VTSLFNVIRATTASLAQRAFAQLASLTRGSGNVVPTARFQRATSRLGVKDEHHVLFYYSNFFLSDVARASL
jgi:hypothetical protein